jgi:hypothetical protein
MGIFDQIRCDMELPDDRLAEGEWLQTKSLECCMLTYTITAAGRLILHRRPLIPAFETTHTVLPSIDTDQHFHGDVEMCGTANDGGLAVYAVRFRHGTVEWILPFGALRHHHQWQPYHDY